MPAITRSHPHQAKLARKSGRPLPARCWQTFVLLIFAYQMLSAMVTQLLEFMVMASAGERFTGSEALASFYGVFSWCST